MNNIQHLLVRQDVSESVTDRVNAMFPTWTTVLATILAVLVLMVILTKLLYHPIKKNFENRKKYIQTNIDEAEERNRHASADREKANDELIQARMEAASIIAQANKEAANIRLEKLSDAKLESKQIIKAAQLDFELKKLQFEEEAKKEMVDIALIAAQKVVEKEVDNKVNKKIITDFINGKVK